MLVEVVNLVNWFILYYLIIISFCYIILLASSIPDVFTRSKEDEVSNIITLMKSHTLPPVTIIIPAYNEEEIILETIRSILKSKYQNLYIIVINDGSKDSTLEKLIQAFALYEVTPVVPQRIKTVGDVKNYYVSSEYNNITVVDKIHSDRSDTLNVGLNACRTPLFITIDADTLVEPDAVSNIIFYMLNRPSCIAVGGAVYILNGCTFKQGQIVESDMSLKPIYAFQTCEYLRSFLFSRSGWNSLGGALCYAGAFTLIDHSIAVKLGGYEVGNLAQDFEIITHLHAYKRERKEFYTIGYTPAAVAWTDVPGTFRSYWNQRFNWQYATLQSLMPYKRMLFNPKFGIVGLFTYPFYLFGETLGAVVEFTAYISVIVCYFTGILNTYWAVLFFMVCLGFLMFLTMGTALMSFLTFNRYKKLKYLLWILFFSVIEPFGFRQFNVVCRMYATICFFKDQFKLGLLKKI